jgi:hypothetical protein
LCASGRLLFEIEKNSPNGLLVGDGGPVRLVGLRIHNFRNIGGTQFDFTDDPLVWAKALSRCQLKLRMAAPVLV